MSWRRECDEAEAVAVLGTALAKEVAREADTALETARAEAAALRTALTRERQGVREQRAARDLDEMTSSPLELQMTISRLEHQLTEQRQQLTEQLTEQRSSRSASGARGRRCCGRSSSSSGDRISRARSRGARPRRRRPPSMPSGSRVLR
jgi:hypothetical protein